MVSSVSWLWNKRLSKIGSNPNNGLANSKSEQKMSRVHHAIETIAEIYEPLETASVSENT